jgi:hypothetical protein
MFVQGDFPDKIGEKETDPQHEVNAGACEYNESTTATTSR